MYNKHLGPKARQWGPAGSQWFRRGLKGVCYIIDNHSWLKDRQCLSIVEPIPIRLCVFNWLIFEIQYGRLKIEYIKPLWKKKYCYFMVGIPICTKAKNSNHVRTIFVLQCRIDVFLIQGCYTWISQSSQTSCGPGHYTESMRVFILVLCTNDFSGVRCQMLKPCCLNIKKTTNDYIQEHISEIIGPLHVHTHNIG